MALQIFDEVSCNLDLSLLQNVYKAFLKHFGFKDFFDVEVTIVDEPTIKEVNNQSRSVDAVTDVLSFPNIQVVFPFCKKNYKDYVDKFSGNIIFGEIMLCIKKAEEQAEEYGHSILRECAYLFLHGLLHLCGFDHMIDEDKLIMRKHEEEILKSLSITRE